MEEKGVVRNFEALRKRKDGSQFWVSQNTIMQTTESSDKQFISTLVDNTERKNAAEALAKLNKDLKSLNMQLEDKVAEKNRTA